MESLPTRFYLFQQPNIPKVAVAAQLRETRRMRIGHHSEVSNQHSPEIFSLDHISSRIDRSTVSTSFVANHQDSE